MTEKDKKIAFIIYKMDALVDLLDISILELESVMKEYKEFRQEKKMEINALRSITKKIVKQNDAILGDRQAINWGDLCDDLNEVFEYTMNKLIEIKDEDPIETIAEEVLETVL